MDWNRAPNNYDKIALVIRQIRASQDRVQRLRMVVPVWRCDAEAPVALLPPAPLRPLSVTSLTSRWTTGPTGAGAAPCALDVAYSATASLAVRRTTPPHRHGGRHLSGNGFQADPLDQIHPLRTFSQRVWGGQPGVTLWRRLPPIYHHALSLLLSYSS